MKWYGLSVLTRQHDRPVLSIKAAIQLHLGQREIRVFNGLLCEDMTIAIIECEHGTNAHDTELGNCEVVINACCQMRCHCRHEPVALRVFCQVHRAISQQMACGQSVQLFSADELTEIGLEFLRVHALNFEPMSISFLALP